MTKYFEILISLMLRWNLQTCACNSSLVFCFCFCFVFVIVVVCKIKHTWFIDDVWIIIFWCIVHGIENYILLQFCPVFYPTMHQNGIINGSAIKLILRHSIFIKTILPCGPTLANFIIEQKKVYYPSKYTIRSWHNIVKSCGIFAMDYPN